MPFLLDVPFATKRFLIGILRKATFSFVKCTIGRNMASPVNPVLKCVYYLFECYKFSKVQVLNLIVNIYS